MLKENQKFLAILNASPDPFGTQLFYFPANAFLPLTSDQRNKMLLRRFQLLPGGEFARGGFTRSHQHPSIFNQFKPVLTLLFLPAKKAATQPV